MRNLNLLILLLLALLATLAFATPSAEAEADPEAASTNWRGNKGNSDWGKGACKQRAPKVQAAIERYCRWTAVEKGFLVPGGRGNRVERNGNAAVSVKANCQPPQYLPWDICFKQFYSMCVSGNGRGENSRTYGRNGCQKWRISNPK